MFEDNFNLNKPGLDSVPTGWTINGPGYVDIIGTCDGQSYYDLLPGNGCYVDLDGSTSPPGKLTKTLSLKAGRSYIAKFFLAGSQDVTSSSDTVDVSFGSELQSYTLNYLDSFSSYSFIFSPLTTGSYALAFLDQGSDSHGVLLDNVSVTDTQARDHTDLPAPLPVLGTGMAFALSRRLRRRIRSFHS